MKIFVKSLALMVLFGLAAGPVFAEVDCVAPVETAAGRVRGVGEEFTCVWKGIPFAAPPVGRLRWASPQPANSWTGVRDAAKFGDHCMQKGIGTLEGMASGGSNSEDCLFLNVWRPKKSGTFPVMVWVHGGGYYIGSGDTPWYWGDRLANNGDLVVVTINYRLNVFGFFAHPALKEEDPNGATGGQGTLDQVAALQWVHDNIVNFGGDPDNVTIFGESAGGWSICTLVATPLTKGLFQRALLESGGCEQSGSLEHGYQQARETAATLGCEGSDDLACMRGLSAKKVIKATGSMTTGVDAKPRHDGYMLTGSPLSMIREGNYNQVSFMAGHNLDEFGNALKLMPKIKRTKPQKYETALVELYSLSEEDASRLVELYPLTEFNNRPVEAYGRMFGADAALACPSYQALADAAKQQSDTYYYRFDYDDMKYGKYLGAAHAMEIPFIFGNLDRMPASALYNKKNIGPATELSETMQGFVINFAKTGNPNGPGLPEWPQYTTDDRQVMYFDTTVRAGDATFHERCEYWNQTEKSSIETLNSMGENVMP